MMDNLEFLLQREGDNTWLPLESPDVQVLEGRYRIVSRGSHQDQEIEIRIVYDAIDETPPVRRIKTLKSYINSEGLMVVIPYTRLKPGIWEFSCSPDLQQGLLGNTWRATMKLQVLANTDIDSEEILDDSPAIEDSLQQQTDVESVTSTTPSEKTSDSNLTDLYPCEIQPETNQETAIAINETADLTTEDISIELILERDSYVVEFGSAVLLSGQIRIKSDPDSDPDIEAITSMVVSNPQLQICLRSPQASEILYDVRQPIPQSVLPVPFSAAIYVPFECKTRLVLGEVVFYSDQHPPVRNSFNITMLVEQFLDPLPEELEIDAQPDQPLVENSSLALSAAHQSPLAIVNKETQAQPVNPQGEPQIALELPSFGNFISDTTPQTEPHPWSNILNISSGSNSEAIALPEVNQEPPASPSLPLTTSASEGSQDEGSSGLSNNLVEIEDIGRTRPDEPAPTDLLNTDQPETPIDSSAESSDATITNTSPPTSGAKKALPHLNLEERFLSRLSSLAKDRDLSHWMKQASSSASNDTAVSPPKEPLVLGEAQTPSPNPNYELSPLVTELEAEEIVVDYESLEPPTVFPQSRSGSGVQGKDLTTESASNRSFAGMGRASATGRGGNITETPSVIPSDQEIPVPILDILTANPTVGKSLKVRVQIPDNLPRIYVKIWIYDRQSRNIVDGPRWITEFSPNGFDKIEATVDLDIIYGSLEIQVEAIAVEMLSSRESHKAIVGRTVSPTSAPTLPMDESSS
ncbi:hypothetical protein ACOKW7_25220 [Limnospira platensis CENA597]|uniref:hypothetical protein n=1 Tax=Limnospira platensis TaxID=118562 RepID=UPI003D9FE70F